MSELERELRRVEPELLAAGWSKERIWDEGSQRGQLRLGAMGLVAQITPGSHVVKVTTRNLVYETPEGRKSTVWK